MTVTDVHTFEADDSGISCVHCGLPEPHARHWTAARVAEHLQHEIDHQLATLHKTQDVLLELQKDQLFWSLAGWSVADGLIDVVPLTLYLFVNVNVNQGDDRDYVAATISEVRGSDGKVLYNASDAADLDLDYLAQDIFVTAMALTPDDSSTYAFKVKPDAERSRNRAYLSMDYLRIEIGEAPLLTTDVGSQPFKLTDEPGKITKLTGPNSVHRPGTLTAKPAASKDDSQSPS